MVINGNISVHTLAYGDITNVIIEPLTTTARLAATHAPGRVVYDLTLAE